jgi:hypothetical protein
MRHAAVAKERHYACFAVRHEKLARRIMCIAIRNVRASGSRKRSDWGDDIEWADAIASLLAIAVCL